MGPAEDTHVEGSIELLQKVSVPEVQPKARKFTDAITEFRYRISHGRESLQGFVAEDLIISLLQGSENLRLPYPSFVEAFTKGKVGGRIARYTKGVIDHGLQEAASVEQPEESIYLFLAGESRNDKSRFRPPIREPNYQESIILVATLKHAVDSLTCAGRGDSTVRQELNEILGDISHGRRIISGRDAIRRQETGEALRQIPDRIWGNCRESIPGMTSEEASKAGLEVLKRSIRLLTCVANEVSRLGNDSPLEVELIRNALKDLQSLLETKP